MLLSLRANSRTAWNPASFSRGARSGALLWERRRPDGLFTFNKIILEEIVISQRNFLASSAILASKLIQEEGQGALRKGRGGSGGSRGGKGRAQPGLTPALHQSPHNLGKPPDPSELQIAPG